MIQQTLYASLIFEMILLFILSGMPWNLDAKRPFSLCIRVTERIDTILATDFDWNNWTLKVVQTEANDTMCADAGKPHHKTSSTTSSTLRCIALCTETFSLWLFPSSLPCGQRASFSYESPPIMSAPVLTSHIQPDTVAFRVLRQSNFCIRHAKINHVRI